MKLSYLLRNLTLIRRNRQWLRSPVRWGLRWSYYPAMAAALIRTGLGRSGRVWYLGAQFWYDNPATPLNLQIYPYEVGVQILRRLDRPPSTVLDIGANVGQFARTVAHLVPGAEIDCFEPNAEIAAVLRRNVPTRVRTFPYAVGAAPARATLYWEPGRSAIGSLLADNAGDLARLRQAPVVVIDDVPRLTGRDTYDLVKIDVEGYECSALAGLRGVHARYLFVEVSGAARRHEFSDGEFHRRLGEIMGDFTVLYSSGCDESSQTWDLLVRAPGRDRTHHVALTLNIHCGGGGVALTAAVVGISLAV